MWDGIAGDDDRIAVNCCLCFNELLIFTGDLEPCQRFVISRHQSATRSVKGESDCVPLYRHRFVKRAGVCHIISTIILCECPQCESSADFLFISGMNISEVSDVGCYRHAGIWQCQCCGLCFPDLWQEKRVCIASAVIKGCKLYKIERKIALSPDFAPTVDECLHLLVVAHAVSEVGFTLIPERAPYGVRDDRMHHAVVKCRRSPLMP